MPTVEVDAFEDLRADTRLERDRDSVEEALLRGVNGGVRGPVRVDESGKVVDGVVGLNAETPVTGDGEGFEGDPGLRREVNVGGEACHFDGSCRLERRVGCKLAGDDGVRWLCLQRCLWGCEDKVEDDLKPRPKRLFNYKADEA